jgi:hypothetical protein
MRRYLLLVVILVLFWTPIMVASTSAWREQSRRKGIEANGSKAKEKGEGPE